MGHKKVKENDQGTIKIKKIASSNNNGIEDNVCNTNTTRKKLISKAIRDEFNYIDNLFDVLNIASLHQGRNDDKDLDLPDVPEKKIFQKKAVKKSAQSIKVKSFPNSIEDLEKELDELRGTPMTYQKQQRKKGLQVRLNKKKRKEIWKQQKAALTQGKLAKSIKPVLNNDGNVVSNKFDFADSEVKKEKRKLPSEFNGDIETKKKFKSKVYEGEKSPVKNEKDEKETLNKKLNNVSKENGPLFNKDNKTVFSKFVVSENGVSRPKKKKEKDPKILLQKIREESKKIKEIEKEDKSKATELKDKVKWSTALKRASGEKVKDDPELLKKSILKEKNLKLRSKKKWDARIESVQKQKDDKQLKRKKNIQARMDEKKNRKKKKAIKKGRIIQL